jgi:hypothetical protein
LRRRNVEPASAPDCQKPPGSQTSVANRWPATRIYYVLNAF